MKKILLIIVLINSFFVNAQTFQGGFRTGMTASQIDGDGIGGYHKIGVNLLAFAQIDLSKNNTLLSGVGYIIKGARTPVKIPYSNTTLQYAQIPLIFSHSLNPKISLSAGLIYGFLISGKQETSYTSYSAEDLGLLNNEYSLYFDLIYKFNNRIQFVFAQHYSLLPVNNYNNIAVSNLFLYYIVNNSNLNPLWWNNTISLSIQYKIVTRNQK